MKFRYLVGFAALALMASCSKQENAQVADDAWVYDESLPVPVTFAAPQVTIESKAVNPGKLENLNGLDIGVFALATGEGAAGWTTTDGAFINNQKVVTGAEDGSITFKPVIYYPMNSEQSYSFFAYYPYQSENIALATHCEITFDINGFTDILWSKAYATPLQDGVTGYNAAYIRRLKAAQGGEEKMPKLRFYHALTSLQFNAQLDGASDVVQLNSMTVRATSQAKLRLASSGAAVDTWTPTWTPMGQGNISVRQEAKGSSSGTLNITLTESPQEVGDIVMLVPGESYEATINMTIGGDPYTFTVPVKRANEGDQFEAGYEYAMTIKVKSPEEVTIAETSLEPWKTTQGSNIELE